jgi:hypothetical protein
MSLPDLEQWRTGRTDREIILGIMELSERKINRRVAFKSVSVIEIDTKPGLSDGIRFKNLNGKGSSL